MRLIILTKKNIKLWESAKIAFKPYGISIFIIKPFTTEDLPKISSMAEKLVPSSLSPVLLLAETPELIPYLPPHIAKNFTIPATPSSARAFIDFLRKTILALYKGETFPSVAIHMQNSDEILSLLANFAFPITDTSSADFIFTDNPSKNLPENKTIALPFEETTTSFIRFITELLYNFVPPDVVKEKAKAEAEISQQAREKLLARRRKKK